MDCTEQAVETDDDLRAGHHGPSGNGSLRPQNTLNSLPGGEGNPSRFQSQRNREMCCRHGKRRHEKREQNSPDEERAAHRRRTSLKTTCRHFRSLRPKGPRSCPKRTVSVAFHTLESEAGDRCEGEGRGGVRTEEGK